MTHLSKPRDTSRDVAIVGMACRFADANDVESLWQNLLERRAGFRPIPKSRWDHDAFYSERIREHDKTYVREGAFVDDVAAFPALHFGIAPRRVEVMDPQHRLVLETTRRALEDAGMEGAFTRGALDRDSVGTFLGVSTTEYSNLLAARSTAMMMASGAFGPRAEGVASDALGHAVENASPISAFSIPGSLLNMAAANIAHHWKFGGPAYTLDAACAASLLAVHDAITHIRAGICDVAVAGGVYVNVTPETLVGFSRIGAISRKGACRPFDAEADGFLQGEGCGVVILKRFEQAVADGDRIYATICGSGVNNDGDAPGPMAPSQEGQKEAIRRAYRDSGVDPSTLGFVACHGTATAVGDPVEVGALRAAIDELVAEAGVPGPSQVALGSVKANVGHTMSAAGIAGLIHAVLALSKETIPPQTGYQTPNPRLDLEKVGFEVPVEPRPWARDPEGSGEGRGPRRAGVSAFGFGGTNVHLVLEEAPQIDEEPAVEAGEAELVVVTADDLELLADHARRLADVVAASEASLRDIAYTLTATRQRLSARLALVVDSKQALIDELREAAERLAQGALPPGGQLGPSAFAGVVEEANPGVAFLFPGQGAQRVDLMRDLYERYPSFRRRLDELSRAADDLVDEPLVGCLYPAAGADADAAEAVLTATEVCQPAMAALGLALAGFLEELGLKPDVTLGHSLGEFVAAAAGGMLSPEEAVRFVARRGRIMADLALDDAGAMAAVMADADALRPYLEGRDGVVLANLNHPQQSVISGASAAVESLAEALEADGIRATLLRVSHAFHSPLVADVDEALGELVEALDLQAPERTVVSAITAAPYTDDLAATRETFVRHATSTVDFIGALQAAREEGADTWIEVGAGKTLSSFAAGVLGKEAFARPMGAKAPDGCTEFQRSLAALVVRGYELELDRLFEGEVGAGDDGQAKGSVKRGRVVSLPATPLATQNYWMTGERARPLDITVGEMPGARPEEDVVTKSTPEAAVEAPEEGSRQALVELFRQQNELLAEHARIIAAQNALLTGGAIPSQTIEAIDEQAPGAPKRAVVQDEQPAEQDEGGERIEAKEEVEEIEGGEDESAVDAEEIVFDAVAEVSAFPLESLKRSHQLAGDLGFDSLMFVDLSSALRERLGSFEAPRELFHQGTTLSELIDFVASGGVAEEGDEEQAEAITALRRYRPTLVERAQPSLPAARFAARGALLVTADAATEALAAAFAAAHAVRGQTVALVRFGESFEAVDTSGDYATLTWGEDQAIPELFEALRAADHAPSAIVEMTSASIASTLTQAQDGAAPNPAMRLQALAAGLSDADAFVVVTAMGDLGLSGARPERAWQGASIGFAKALAREWPKAIVRGVDLDPELLSEAPQEAARALLAELDGAAQDVEISLGPAGRRGVTLQEAPFTDDAPIDLGSDDLILVTGGAKGLGAKFSRALAERFGVKLLLVGRTASAEADPEIAAHLATLRKMGVRAEYASWDVTEPAPDAVIEAIEGLGGAITGLVHTAGVLRDARVDKKSADDVRVVTEVKVGGLVHALALAGEGLKVVVATSTWSARVGNIGQTDYSAANEAMNRLLEAWAVEHPEVKVVSADWPLWEDSEMVRQTSKAALKAMTSQGIVLVPDAVGVDAFLAELSTPGSGEFAYGGEVPRELRTLRGHQTLALQTHPYLGDHRLRDAPVMPLANALDYTAGAARAAGMAGDTLEIRDLTLFSGVEVERDVNLALEVDARLGGGEGRDGEARVELATLDEGQRTLAYRATVVGPTGGAEKLAILEPARDEVIRGDDLPMTLEEFYARHTFHGPRLAGVTAVDELGEHHVVGRVATSRPSDWIEGEALDAWQDDTWYVDPLTVDASFQLVAYWFRAKLDRAGFPVHVGRFIQERPFEPGQSYGCTVTLEEGEDDRWVGSIVYRDGDDEVVAVMHGVEARLLTGEAEAAVEIDESLWMVEKFPEIEALDQRLQMASMIGLRNPYFHPHDGPARDVALFEGREMINFSSYNYLGFSGDPDIAQAVKDAVDRYGTSASASRLASGEIPLHGELERALADCVGVEAALVFSAGHATNESVIGHLFGEGDLIIHDSLAHNSIMTGAELSGAKRMSFPHNDWAALDRLLGQLRPKFGKVVIIIEGVYSMDGDIPDLPRFIEVRDRHRCLLYVDEAHSMGIIGKSGRGIAEHFGIDPTKVDIWMGTLSKSFASCGGYVAGKKRLIEYLKYTVPGFIFSAGISPANAAAALAGVRRMRAEPELPQRLQARAKFFLEACREAGIDTGMSEDSAVVPCIVGNSFACLKLSERLGERGINVQPIIYPAVDDEASRLRFFLSATHTEEQLTRTVEVLTEELAAIESGAAAE